MTSKVYLIYFIFEVKKCQFLKNNFTKPKIHMFKIMRKLLMMPILVKMLFDIDIVWKVQDALFHKIIRVPTTCTLRNVENLTKKSLDVVHF
jgi:hypothetical protein